MQVIKAIFDGKEIKPTEPIKTRKKTEVLIIFPNELSNISSSEARRLLRGSSRGQRLTERLLKARKEDLELE